MKSFEVIDPTSPQPDFGAVCALAVMTKAPQPGRVKTRLSPPLTPAEAAELNKAFLMDTAAAIAKAAENSPAREVAVFTPRDAAFAYVDILPADFILLPQRGESFGDRLYFATRDLFQCGFAAVCLIDSDSPTVPSQSFAKAVELLNSNQDRLVLGPSDDGGYYLIGLNNAHREIFERIDWSTDRVLDQTVQRATETGMDVTLLPRGYDIDDAASLRRLYDELLRGSGEDSVAPTTRKLLADLATRKNW